MKKITLEFELQPCPFCAEDTALEITKLDIDFMIECNACRCYGPAAISRTEAAEKWNQRLVPTS